MTKKQLDRVLAWVNRLRKRMGRKPIRKLMPAASSMWSSQGCCLASSLGGNGVTVGYSMVWLNSSRYNADDAVKLPKYVQEFHDKLLDGKLSQFEAQP